MLFNAVKVNKIFNFIKLKNKFLQKLKKIISHLKIIEDKIYQSLNFLLIENNIKENNQNYLISYIIYFCFSNSNSFIHITNSEGYSKFFCSAGSLDLIGKQKVSKKLVLIRFLKTLNSLKKDLIVNKPVALHLRIRDSRYYKYFIIKKLKHLFFIKNIKSFSLTSYNGCRKKKKRRKR